MWLGNRKESRKLTFRALALCLRESNCNTRKRLLTENRGLSKHFGFIFDSYLIKTGQDFWWLSNAPNKITNVPFHSFNSRIKVIRDFNFTILETPVLTGCVSAEWNCSDYKKIAEFSQNINLKRSVLGWEKKFRWNGVPVKMTTNSDRPITMVFINFTFTAHFESPNRRGGCYKWQQELLYSQRPTSFHTFDS